MPDVILSGASGFVLPVISVSRNCPEILGNVGDPVSGLLFVGHVASCLDTQTLASARDNYLSFNCMGVPN